MKKTLALLLALVMVLFLYACGGKNTDHAINDAPANSLLMGRKLRPRIF